MLLHGEKLKGLFGDAVSSILICSPFIKVDALEVLLENVRSGVAVKVVTRWKASEVALGVSDLEVFDLIQKRENAQLYLIDDLHAKCYFSDDRCLTGSANVTAKALGWSQTPNVEILVEVPGDAQEVKNLLLQLQSARAASFNERQKVAEEADNFVLPEEAQGPEPGVSDKSVASRAWLPTCGAPDRLFEVYNGDQSAGIAFGTYEDAQNDLSAIAPPPGLIRSEFEAYVADVIVEMPGFQRVISEIPSKVNDQQGAYIVRSIEGRYTEEEGIKQWQIVRDWIKWFLSDRFEVAPESFVVRLRSK